MKLTSYDCNNIPLVTGKFCQSCIWTSSVIAWQPQTSLNMFFWFFLLWYDPHFSHSELAQMAWQASYMHVMLHLYQKSASLEILGQRFVFSLVIWHGITYTRLVSTSSFFVLCSKNSKLWNTLPYDTMRPMSIYTNF